MNFEFVIYLSIIVIFVILVRHLPSVISKDKESNHKNDLLGLNKKEGENNTPIKPSGNIFTEDSSSNGFFKEKAAKSESQKLEKVEPEPVSLEEKEKSIDAFFEATSGDFDDLGSESLVKRDESAGFFSANSNKDLSSTSQSMPNLSKINSPTPTAVAPKKNLVASGLSAVKGLIAKNSIKKPIKAKKPVTPIQKTQDQTPPESKSILDGDKFFASGDLNRAEDSYLRAVAINPNDPKVYNRLGAIYLKNKNFKDALESFEVARDLDGGRASRHYNVALAAYESKDFVKAKSAIDNALRLDSSSQNYKQLKELISVKEK